MIRTKDPDEISVSTLLEYCDTGESGEAYEIDVQTLPWSKTHHIPALADNLRAFIQKCDCSESGDAYEAEAEVSRQEAY